ncbi:MAG: glycosyltransferase [Gemmatimonadales bacterium]
MRVVHVARGRDWRGGERQVLHLMLALAREPGLEQSLFTAADCALAHAAAESGLTVHGAAWRAGPDPRALIELHRLLRHTDRPCLLHAHDSHALMLGYLAGRWRHCPVVATRRSVTVPGRHGPWPRATEVIAISRAVEQALLDGGVAADRITVIPSTVPVARLLAQSTRPAADGPIVAIGALTSEKGHDVLLAALAIVVRHRPATRLIVAGTGPARAALLRQARALGIADRVEFRGEVDDIPALLRQATVLAHPSRREALGAAVLEAMALGVPVVASRTGGLIELLDGEAGLLVPPEDPAALAAALLTLLTDPNAAAALAATARQRVCQYDDAGMTGRVIQVYRSMCVAP